MHEEMEEQCGDDKDQLKELSTNGFCLWVHVCLECNSCGYTHGKFVQVDLVLQGIIRISFTNLQSIRSTATRGNVSASLTFLWTCSTDARLPALEGSRAPTVRVEQVSRMSTDLKNTMGESKVLR